MCRMKSLESAVKLLEAMEIQNGLISDQLNHITQKPVNIANFSIDQSKTLHEDIKV